MDEKRKAISADDRLRAFALFTMSKEHRRKALEFEASMCEVLCIPNDDLNYLSDLIWDTHQPGTMAEFEKALVRDGIAIVEVPDGG